MHIIIAIVLQSVALLSSLALTSRAASTGCGSLSKISVALQAASLGTAYTLMVSQTLLMAMICLGNTYPHCKGSSWRQTVAPALITIFLLLLFFEILQPTRLGHDLFVLSQCPFSFRLALSGFLLLQYVTAVAGQVYFIRRSKSAKASCSTDVHDKL